MPFIINSLPIGCSFSKSLHLNAKTFSVLVLRTDLLTYRLAIQWIQKRSFARSLPQPPARPSIRTHIDWLAPANNEHTKIHQRTHERASERTSDCAHLYHCKSFGYFIIPFILVWLKFIKTAFTCILIYLIGAWADNCAFACGRAALKWFISIAIEIRIQIQIQIQISDTLSNPQLFTF